MRRFSLFSNYQRTEERMARITETPSRRKTCSSLLILISSLSLFLLFFQHPVLLKNVLVQAADIDGKAWERVVAKTQLSTQSASTSKEAMEEARIKFQTRMGQNRDLASEETSAAAADAVRDMQVNEDEPLNEVTGSVGEAKCDATDREVVFNEGDGVSIATTYLDYMLTTDKPKKLKNKFFTIVYSCTLRNLGAVKGTNDCINKETTNKNINFSETCATCFAQASHCSLEHCKRQCFQNVCSDGCIACCVKNCGTAARECTGFEYPAPCS